MMRLELPRDGRVYRFLDTPDPPPGCERPWFKWEVRLDLPGMPIVLIAHAQIHGELFEWMSPEMDDVPKGLEVEAAELSAHHAFRMAYARASI